MAFLIATEACLSHSLFRMTLFQYLFSENLFSRFFSFIFDTLEFSVQCLLLINNECRLLKMASRYFCNKYLIDFISDQFDALNTIINNKEATNYCCFLYLVKVNCCCSLMNAIFIYFTHKRNFNQFFLHWNSNPMKNRI